MCKGNIDLKFEFLERTENEGNSNQWSDNNKTPGRGFNLLLYPKLHNIWFIHIL